MTRTRPERKASQWAEIDAATRWYTEQCKLRGTPRDEALEYWEGLTIIARIRRWKQATKAQNQPLYPTPGPTCIGNELVNRPT